MNGENDLQDESHDEQPDKPAAEPGADRRRRLARPGRWAVGKGPRNTPDEPYEHPDSASAAL